MPKKEQLTAATPGAARQGRLPEPPPAGQMPDENSRLWQFVPKAIVAGEKWIQDDTREWFDENGRKVQICRRYPTHPRWLVGRAAETYRAKVMHAGIISEIHMLARLEAEMPEIPAWFVGRLSLKQAQADLGYRLTRTARGVFLAKGKQAMEDFADRSPGQFIKFIGGTFVPKQIESNVTLSPGQSLDPEEAENIIQALGAELKRREEEATFLKNHPADYEETDVAGKLLGVADRFNEATGATPDYLGSARTLRPQAAYRLNKVVDLEADEYERQPTPPGEIEWD